MASREWRVWMEICVMEEKEPNDALTTTIVNVFKYIPLKGKNGPIDASRLLYDN
jgi:hypothetical protein